MASNRYTVEYAKTGRANCKDSQCKTTIEKESLRIGKVGPNPFSDDPEDTKTDWFHAECIFNALTRVRAGTKRIDNEDDVEGLDSLEDKDKKKVKDLIKEYTENGYAKKKAAPKKRKGKDDADDGDDDEKPKKKSKVKSPAKKKAPKRKKDDDEDDAGSDAEEDEEKPKKKAPTKKAPVKKAKKADAEADGDSGGIVEATLSSDSKSGGKFWTIKQEGSQVTVTFGKEGTDGQTQVKDFDSAAKAKKEALKQIAAKKKKGYE